MKKKKQLRSLQQRVCYIIAEQYTDDIAVILFMQCYERCSKAIKNTSEKEKKYWSDITADMMSDEEKEGDTYIRHPPGYRSERLYSKTRRTARQYAVTPCSPHQSVGFTC